MVGRILLFLGTGVRETIPHRVYLDSYIYIN